MYDLPKLAFQTMTLVLYLRKGFPITIVAFYCTMLTVNWLISFYRFQRKTFDSALLIARVFYLCVLRFCRAILPCLGLSQSLALSYLAQLRPVLRRLCAAAHPRVLVQPL